LSRSLSFPSGSRAALKARSAKPDPGVFHGFSELD
jgi:hypothetical protein